MDDSIAKSLIERYQKEQREIENKNLGNSLFRFSPETYIHLLSIWLLSLDRNPNLGFSVEFRETNKSISLLINLTDPGQGPAMGVRVYEKTGYWSFREFLERHYRGLRFYSDDSRGSTLK